MKMLAAMWLLLALAVGANAGTATNTTTTTTNAVPVDAQREYQLGLGLLQDNNFAGAADCFERATKARPDFAEAYAQWGVALRRLGQVSASLEIRFNRYREAAERFQKAAGLKPQERSVWLMWGETLTQIGDLPVQPQLRLSCYQGAAEQYRKATELAPGESDAFGKWADVLTSKLVMFATDERAQVLMQKDAASLYSNAVERATFTADIAGLYVRWGVALVRAAKAETDPTEKQALLRLSLEKLERSARTVSNNATTYTMWGSALMQLGKLTRLRSDYRDAVDKFNISLSLRPDDPTTLYALACTHALMSNPILAVESLKQCFAAETDGVYRKLALRDPDLDGLRSERGFQELYEVKTPSGIPADNPRLSDTPLRLR